MYCVWIFVNKIRSWPWSNVTKNDTGQVLTSLDRIRGCPVNPQRGVLQVQPGQMMKKRKKWEQGSNFPVELGQNNDEPLWKQNSRILTKFHSTIKHKRQRLCKMQWVGPSEASTPDPCRRLDQDQDEFIWKSICCLRNILQNGPKWNSKFQRSIWNPRLCNFYIVYNNPR